MSDKMIRVEHCGVCPYVNIRAIADGGFYCIKVPREIKGGLNPEWCPLEYAPKSPEGKDPISINGNPITRELLDTYEKWQIIDLCLTYAQGAPKASEVECKHPQKEWYLDSVYRCGLCSEEMEDVG